MCADHRSLEKEVAELRVQLHAASVLSEAGDLRKALDRKEKERLQLSIQVEVGVYLNSTVCVCVWGVLFGGKQLDVSADGPLCGMQTITTQALTLLVPPPPPGVGLFQSVGRLSSVIAPSAGSMPLDPLRIVR